MKDTDVVERIKQLCQTRSWTYYRLAKEAGIPYSTLNTMLHKTNVPSVPTLAKLCLGFGISMAQFFSDKDEASLLRQDQKVCLAEWDALDDKSRALALAYMHALKDRQES